jgi:hypothetical protein
MAAQATTDALQALAGLASLAASAHQSETAYELIAYITQF